MSIEREYGSFVLVCDICGETVPEPSFDDAVAAKKIHGWRSRRGEDGEWYDACPSCQEALA